ncbi:LCP family glycopolymer transferase [Anaerorhabdus sp.]|uniref:LCP family glycopolymer transferase n=1 Tax=Anaerorhabdus sp. TaxID=1872524 RepID=UPI002FC84A27
MTKRKEQTRKAKRIKRDLTVVNIIFTVLALAINLMMWWSIFSLTRYSSFSKLIFIVINVVVLLLMLVMNYMLFMLIKTRKVSFMNTVSAMLVVFMLVGTFATYATTKINVNVNKITDSGSKNEKVETSLVVYSESGTSSIASITDLDGKTVGYIEGANDGTMALDELAAKNINATTVAYTDYITLAQALFIGEVDCAALPSNYVGLLEVNEGFSEYLDKTTAISTFDKVVKVETESGSAIDVTKEPFTVLILGVDEGRSDAIMVASFNPISLNVTLSSIARDSYVPIACYSGKNSDKLGHARARNRQCSIDTIEDLLDIDIDYYFESNFKGVIDMVDALGGIVVNNPIEFVGQNASSERGHFTVWVPAGESVPLNGEQALAFARERHKYASGDFQRQANQQQVIEAILRQVMRLRDVNKGLAMLDAAGENVSTNMSVDQLISLFNYSMKKAGRYYDKTTLENVFNIIGSRVTGYSTSIWNDANQMTLSIVRLFEGAIEDTHNAIIRNTDMNSPITAPKFMKWNANWEFTAPVIANETYSEERIVSEVPDTLPKFTTLGKLQGWANSFGIALNIQEIGEGMEGYDANLADGTIIWQDVPAGTAASSITTINVKVIRKAAKTAACPADAPGTYPNCVCTDTTKTFNKDKGVCEVPTGKEHTLTVRYVVADGGVAAPATVTQKVVEGASYSVQSPALTGYTADVTTVTGTMPAKDVDVTVTYKKPTTPTATPDTTTEKGCIAAAMKWYNGKCYKDIKTACEANGKVVDEAGTGCKDKPPVTPTCGANATYDQNAKACVCNSGFEGDPVAGCVAKPVTPTCGANATYDQNAKACVCNPGFEGDPVAGCIAKPVTPTCGANATYDQNAKACVCNPGFEGDPAIGCSAIISSNTLNNSLIRISRNLLLIR